MFKIKVNDVLLNTNASGNIYADIALPASLNNVKITKAKLKLVVNKDKNSNNNEEISVNYEYVKDGIVNLRWENIDHLSNLANGDVIYIDFLNELQDACTLGASNLHLVFCKNTTSDLTFNEINSSNVDVECISLYEYESNSGSHEIDCGRAGVVSINLSTGEFSLNHFDVKSDSNTLPLIIAHNYNSSPANNFKFFNDENFDTHCGKGWKLNIQQYLKKVNSRSNLNNGHNQDNSLNFEYIDATGKTQLLHNSVKIKSELEDLPIKSNHLKGLIKTQVPVYYLCNDDNIIYGFGKTADENIFRLILITDAYGNGIYINYEDLNSNKIISLINSTGNSFLFNYNKQDLLESIVDSRNRKINFEYENNLLTKITYPDKNYSQYLYNPDNKIIAVIDQSGLGKYFEYNDKGKVTRIMTYHKDEPSRKFYQEFMLDEKGRITSSINEFGITVSNYVYLDGTNIILKEIDKNGNIISYDYDKNVHLIGLTTSSNGEENTNIYGYTLNYLTSLKHNDFEYNYEYDNLGKLNRILIANEVYFTKSYTDNSETITYKNGATFKRTFNSDGKITSVEYNQAPILENVYDPLGNLIKSTDKTNNESNVHNYYYDKFGNLYKETSTQHSINVEIKNTIDKKTGDTTASEIKLGNKTLNYSYNYNKNFVNKLDNVVLPNKKTQYIVNDKLCRTYEIKLDSHIKLYHYLSNGDHTSNLISSVWYGDRDKINGNYRYKYDEKGNIIEIKENSILIARYKYDNLSRLIREDNRLFNKTTTIEYDAGGNIVFKLEYLFTLTDNLNESTPAAIYPYLYKSTGWRDQLVSYNGENFAYDEVGNPTTCRGETLIWSHARQVVQLGDCKYTYNANGIRTSKIVNGVKTKFFLNGNRIIAQDDGNIIYYHYGADGIVGFTLQLSNTDIQEYTYKKNIQGDIIGIYELENVLICKYIYDAWGNTKTLILSSNGSYVDISSTSNDTCVNTKYLFIANLNPFRYRGYYFDTETGLYYINNRYYDPEIGRFINADEIGNIDTENLNGFNLYIYCANNPVNNVQPKEIN